MGTESLNNRSGGQTVQAQDVNQYNAALSGDVVPRTAGVPTSGAGSLGQSGLPWDDIFFDGNLVLGGNVVRLDVLQAQGHEIVSGKAKTSGFPDFLSVVSGTTGSIQASTTNLQLVINQIQVSITNNINLTGLSLAPGTNNTCAVNDASLSGQEYTKWLGEDGKYLTIGTIGSEITNVNGTIQAFKIGSEYFLALVDTTNNRLYPFQRAVGSSPRSAISNTNTITLMKATYVFIDADASTTYQTTIYPAYQSTDPSGVSGQFFYNTDTNRWRYYTSSWSNINAHFIGFFICDDTAAVIAHSNDFSKKWDSLADGVIFKVDNDTVRVVVDRISVAGKEFIVEGFGQNILLSASGDRESGVSESSSTTYYIYLDDKLKARFSTVAPRFNDGRQGRYHPSEYWRFIGAAYNDGSSNIQDAYWCPSFAEGRLISQQVFTSSGTYVKNPKAIYVIAEVVGGGGGGGSSNGTNNGTGGGGGGGGYSRKIIAFPGPTVTVTVGGAASSSSFGSHISATGGSSGGQGPTGGGGAGGTGSGGDVNLTGQAGQAGWVSTDPASGAGGASALGFGTGGAAVSANNVGNNGNVYGGGASGGHASSGGTVRAGGTGSSGIVIVSEYW